MTQSGATYHGTHVIIFSSITPLDWEGITHVVATSLVHVIVRKDGSCMDFMGSFGYSQTIRWCYNIEVQKCIWWTIDLNCYEICLNKINHGYLWCNILLSMKDWCMENLRFKHHGDHCWMDAFLLWFNILYVLNIWFSLGKMPYVFLGGHHHIIEIFVIHHKMNCLFLLRYYFFPWKKSSIVIKIRVARGNTQT